MSGPKRGRIVIVSGPSGVGKGSVVRELLEHDEFELSVSATTRAPRPGEVEGKHYHFLSEDEFLRRREAGEFLESAQYNGRWYGTPAPPILEHLAAGRHVILEIEVQGADLLRARGLEPLSIFLEAPSEAELRRRLEGRGDTPPEEIERRLRRAKEELEEAWRYDHRLVNDDLAATVARIRTILSEA